MAHFCATESAQMHKHSSSVSANLDLRSGRSRFENHLYFQASTKRMQPPKTLTQTFSSHDR